MALDPTTDELIKEIIEKAHLSESSNLCRELWARTKIQFEDIVGEDLERLRRLINIECYRLLEDTSYSMIRGLEVNVKIKKDKWGYYLTAKGSYFDEREAVTFWNPKTKDIDVPQHLSFCGWASGCNRIPFIIGFSKWCEEIAKIKQVLENGN